MMSSFPWELSTMNTATMSTSSDQSSIFLAILQSIISIIDLLVTIGADAWTRLAGHVSSWSQLSPFRNLSELIYPTDTASVGSTIASELSDDAFLFDRTLGILCRLPSLPSMSNTSGGIASIPDLPFFNVVLISACLLYIVYRAYDCGRSAILNEGPTGTVAEIVASLSIENEELRSTIERHIARNDNKDVSSSGSSAASGVYVFNAGTIPSTLSATSVQKTTLSPATPYSSSVNLLEAVPNHGDYPTPVGSFLGGSTMTSRAEDSPCTRTPSRTAIIANGRTGGVKNGPSGTVRRRRRSLSADGVRRLRRKTLTVESGLFDFAV